MSFTLLLIILMFALIMVTVVVLNKKISNMQILLKKHQRDITSLSNDNNQISIKQKLLFFVSLSFIQETSEYAKNEIKQRFQIDDKIINDNQLLLKYLKNLTQQDNFVVKVKNGKYIFKLKNKKI